MQIRALRYVFRNRQKAPLPVKLYDVRGIDGVEHFTGVFSKAGNAVPQMAPVSDFVQQLSTFGRIIPNTYIENCAAEKFLTRVSIPALKRFVDVYEPAFVHCGNGECDWAGPEDLRKSLFRLRAALLCISQGLLRLL